MTKFTHLLLALASLTLAAGCLAGPVAAPLAESWPAGGRIVSMGVAGQPYLLALPAAAAAKFAVAPLPPTPAPTGPTSAEPAPADASLGQLPLVVLPLVAQPGYNQARAGEPAARVPILEYHYSSFEMLPTVMMRPAWLQAQLQWLSESGFHTLSSQELAGFVAGRQAEPARSVALTFDVGASHFDEYSQDIVSALRRYHLRAIFFVMPSQTRESCDGKTACWPSLLAWRDEGLISIESHSFTHQDYATLSPEMLAYDIARSKAAIEAKTGQPVFGLCYPFDSVTPAAYDLLAKAGYRFAVAGATRHDRSAEWNDPQPYALPRYYPYSGDSSYPLIGGTGGLTFEQMMLGAVQP